MKKQVRKIPFQQTRAAFRPDTFNEETRTVEVTFATETAVRMFDWDNWEEVDEILVCTPEAADLSRLNSGGPVLDNHKTGGKTAEVVVGVVESARVENNVCVARIRFGSSEDDIELMNKVKDGIVTGISVGYRVMEYSVVRSDGKKPQYRATKWQANEISFTPVQADQNSRVRSADVESASEATVIDESTGASDASGNGGADNDTNNTDNATGTSAATDTDTNGTNDTNDNNEVGSQSENNAETGGENINQSSFNRSINTNPVDMTEQEKQTRALERERVNKIRSIGKKLNLSDTFIDSLVNDDAIDLATASQRALEEWEKNQPITPKANAGQRSTEADKKRSDMANALTLRINPQAASLMDAEQVNSARNYSSMPFLRFAEEALIDAGTNTRGLSPREIATLALGGRVRGLHATTDFPLLLVETVNRTLLAQYAQQPRTFLAFCRRATISDFRPITRVRLSEILGSLDEVKEGAEYKYGTLSESGETYKLAKFGKIIGITWESIVNDDLSAFTRLPQSFAAKAAIKQSDIVYSILLTNPNMADGKGLFHADHGNYKGTAGNLTTGGTALTETSLDEAMVAFLNQKDQAGDFIGVQPRFLIVGPKNKLVAQKLTSANFVPAQQSDIASVAALGLTVIVEPRITTHAWFLAADASAVDTIEYAFLDGEGELFIEQREGFNVDGLEVKARMVFAAKAIDWRGLYRNNGAAPA